MRILVQLGNLGNSVTSHLVEPIARVTNVTEIMLVTKKPGPGIDKVKYYCPPGFLGSLPVAAVICEFVILIVLAVFKRPDFIAGYLLFPHGIMAYITAKFTRKPVVLSIIAGPVELFSIGSPSHFDHNAELTLYGKCMLAVLRKANAVITTGSFTRDFLIKHRVPGRKIFPIICYPDFERYYPVYNSIKYDVILVGRLEKVKNIETALLAFREVKNIIPDFKACILGDGPCRKQLEKTTRTLGLKNNLAFPGFRHDVNSYLNKSRVFLLSSKREGFPNVYLEALLCGLPAVVSNCGDITSIARDGYNAFIINDASDYKAFAAAITSLLTDEGLYQCMAGNVRTAAASLVPADNTASWVEVIRHIGASFSNNQIW
ncbi:MAG: glycosyltransferase [Dehalococcoidales bacterium]|nr:glycosyltransferase [Dehalococcoidales bacterium]